MNIRRRLAAMVLIGTCLWGVVGCGYDNSSSGDGSSSSSSSKSSSSSGYQWKSLYRQDVDTVHVPIFKNTTFQQGIEFALTKAVINKLEVTTPYKVASADTADTVLEGEITSIKTTPISQDPNSTLPQEQLMTVTINFLWKDLRTGRILAQRRSFDQNVTYYPTLGEGQWVGSQDAVERLALAVVHELQRDW